MRSGWFAALARAAITCVPVACAQPSVDALVVWIESVGDDDATRQVQVYDSGDRIEATFRPEDEGSTPDLLQLGVDGQARGVLASGKSRTQFFELGPDGGRQGFLDVSVSDADTSFQDLAPDFFLTRGSDAVLREILPRGEVTRWAMLPLTGPRALRPVLLSQPGPPSSTTLRWSLGSASDASILTFTEVTPTPIHPEGDIVVVAYPSAHGVGASIDQPVELSRGRLEGRAIDDGLQIGRLTSEHCPDRVCIAPSGRVVYTMGKSPCSVVRWAWADAAPGTEPAPIRIDVPPEACPGSSDPLLAAVVDDDTIVLDDERRIYTYTIPDGDLPGVARSAPKLADGLERFVRIERGHAYIYLTPAGEMMRVDAQGPRIVSTERSVCTVEDGFAVSPSGNWAILTCGAVTEASGVGGGVVIRVSPLGLEQFFGISMFPLAIDDDGTAMLYSFDRDESPEDRVPRGLFVLDGTGELARIDELEPAPAAVGIWDTRLGRTAGRFAARARP